LVIGPSAASQEIAVLFGSAGAPVQISDKAVGALWAKLILNCAYNALSAISELPYGSLVQGKGVEAPLCATSRKEPIASRSRFIRSHNIAIN
jgi:2-dehydropantoate 2-reductase